MTSASEQPRHRHRAGHQKMEQHFTAPEQTAFIAPCKYPTEMIYLPSAPDQIQRSTGAHVCPMFNKH